MNYDDHPISIAFKSLADSLTCELDQGVLLGNITSYLESWMKYTQSELEIVRTPTTTLTIVLTHEINNSPYGE